MVESGDAPSDDYEFLRKVCRNAASPKLKLFFSADIVGSTAYKQPLSVHKTSTSQVVQGSQAKGSTFDWVSYIQQFYNKMTEGFIHNFTGVERFFFDRGEQDSERQKHYLGARPVFWKTVGDEVIFWKLLEHEDQIWLSLQIWMKTIADVRDWLHREGTGLDIKCTVWCAGFPVRNRAIVARDAVGNVKTIGKDGDAVSRTDMKRATKLAGKNKYALCKNALIIEKYYRDIEWDAPVDFIGSGIDIGFRIATMATTRRMAISLDVAYLMALSILPKSGSTGVGVSGYEPFNAVNFADFLSDDSIGYKQNFRLFEEEDDDDATTPEFVKKLGVYYSGTEKLKGVLGGIDYPRFWINIEKKGSLDSRKTKLNNEYLKPLPWARLIEFCIAFYEDRRNFVFAPFIQSTDDTQISKTSQPANGVFNYKELHDLAMISIGLMSVDGQAAEAEG